MSRNLVEIVRRHHEVGAPTALAVLKEAMERRGEITDEDRRVAAERSGLPEAAVRGVSTSCPEYKVVPVDVRPVAEQASRTPAIASAS